MPNKVWDKITYPFGATVEVWERISHFMQPIVIDLITYIYPC